MADVFIMGLFNMPANWAFNLFRWLFAFIDFLVYGFVSVFFRTIFHLANFELIGFYEIFEKRIYVVLGIFMLFKVTVSLINYLVNPDKISDKEQGMAKVVTRIITVLVMLIALPTFFNLMTEFQNKLLPVVPRVIMGTANTLSSDDVSGIANNMSLTLLQGFASYKSDECSSDPDVQTLSTLSDFLEHINDTCESSNGKKIYAYDYLPGISTIVGILMLYVLFSLCITVAIRAFKLIILRMLAPIPVVSYIDPKSSKDGMFATWTKTFMSTWAELFILLGLIYFIVYMIDFILSADFWVGFFNGITNPIDGILLLAFLIIGLLMFAKQAPKFISDALGIKTKGAFTRMLGMGAAALGMGGTVASSLRARNQYDQEHGQSHRIRNLGASLFNGLASGSAAGNAILSSDKPTLRTGFDAQTKYNAGNLSNIHAGIGLLDRGKASATSLLFGSTPLDDMDRQIAAAKAKSSTAKQLKEYSIGEGKKKTAHIKTDYTFTDELGIKRTQNISLDGWNQAIAYANSADGDGYVHFSDGSKVAAASSLANKIQGDLEERAGRIYNSFASAHATNDTVVQTSIQSELQSDFGIDATTFAQFSDGKYSDPGALDSFRKTLADSLGIEVSELAHYHQRDNDGNLVYDTNGNPVYIDLYNDPSQVKKIEKSNQTEAFRIENSSEYSDAKKIYGKKS